MKDLLLILAHLLTTPATLLGPGGAKAIVADSLLLKQQLIVINRSRRRAPNLTVIDRLLLGFWSLFLSSHRIRRAAVIFRPPTLLNFHNILKKRKYRLLYTARRKGKPGPKGPSQALIEAIVELKRRNTRFGCPRIAHEINKAFGLNIDKDVVQRVLEKHLSLVITYPREYSRISTCRLRPPRAIRSGDVIRPHAATLQL